jgi:glycosyltransferase involved in cell wall biosynthesis
VLPTREDCFGLAYLEALACGTPCVGTRIMAVPEILREGVTGRLVPPRDPRSLAQVLKENLAGGAALAAQSAAARADAVSRFSLQVLGTRWAETYARTACAS